MKSKARLRKLILWTAAALMILIILVLTQPLWLPWVLRPIAQHYGIRYSKFIREGYSRFAVESAVYSNGPVQVEAGRVEAFVPTVWLWNHFRKNADVPYLRAANWRLKFASSSSAGSETSVYTNGAEVAAFVGQINPWVPNATFTNGSIQIEKQTLTLPRVTWQNGKFVGVAFHPGLSEPIAIDGVAPGAKPWGLRAEYRPLNVRAELVAAQSASSLTISGPVLVETNRLDLDVEFTRAGLLPKRALFECRSFSFPGRFVRLQAYVNLTGALAFIWNGTNFTADIRANAASPENSKLPPIDLTLRAVGDPGHAEIEQLKFVLPGLQAELSTNVAVPILRGAPPAVFKVAGDLRQQPWFALEGLVHGEVLLRAGTNSIPRADFKLAATNFGISRIKVSKMDVAGEVDWPIISVRDALASVETKGRATFSTMLDVARSEIQQGRLQYDGPLPAGVLPPGYSSENVSLGAEFAGSFTNIRHKTDLRIGSLRSSQLQPINADLTLDGQGSSVAAKGSLRAAASVLRVALSTRIISGTNEARIDEISLESRGRSLLRLDAPVEIRLASKSAPGGRANYILNLPPLRLRGGDREIDLEAKLQWPDQGTCRGEVRGIALEDFEDFFGPNARGVSIQQLQFASEWKDGPLNFLLVGSGAYAPGVGFTARGEIRGEASGLLLSNVTVSSQSAPVVTVRGFLPITINPGATTNFIGWRPSDPLNLQANLQPDVQFWTRVRDLTGIEVTRPQLNIDVSGSWRAPTGSVHASVGVINLHQTNRPLPAVENLQLTAELNAQKLRLQELRFEVEKQPVLVTAELPLDAQFYDAVASRKFPDWRRGSVHLVIEQAPVSAFTRYLPKLLAPAGTISVDTRVQPGGELQGEISLEGATSQPIDPIGAVRDINAHLQLKGKTITLDRFAATIGGEPLQASGTLDAAGTEWLHGELPPFRLRFTGGNVPLVRQPEVILRSDFDLNAVHRQGKTPLISGTINLRDSFYTSDLESLIPDRVRKPSHRPPYLSIETQPLANWQLDCQVKGKNFLKLRTPFFKGTVSADFKLEGTLREPLASGEARVTQGEVNFPFGTLEMKQGIVSLTAANPYQPAIYATARSRRYGYDVTMEVTGTADNPVLQFSSVPSLASEQILLLLTAGEIPREELNFTPQQKAQRFALFFGQRMLTQLGFGGGAERLTVRSGEDISESGHTTYDVEYKLNKNWSLVGQYDRFNEFNLSVKRRIYSR